MKKLMKKIDDLGVEEVPEKPNLEGDRFNVYILIILYVIQGFPIGLTQSLSIILQSKKMMTYGDQALFSIALYPYCMKLLWAPVIDALYIKWIGRRKSWLLPLQILMGTALLYLASNIDEWIPETGKPNLKMIIMVVFVINFLSATQDIVVDGWSLTLLKKRNISYSSICNSVGVPLGMFIGTVCFTLLVSEDFCNKYFRTGSGGLMTMKSFLNLFGTISLLFTIFIGIFKKEKHHELENGYVRITVIQNYVILWKVLKVSRIRILAIALLTSKICFAAADSLSSLKLIDSGIPKESIMLISSVMYTVKFFMPLFVSKYVTAPTPMSYYLKLTPFRSLWSITFAILIYYTPSLILKDGVFNVSPYYYLTLGLITLINELLSFFMLMVLFAFFCRISDPRFGGTYMTLFNTCFYVGFLMSNTIVLKLVAILTFSKCSNDAQNRCHTQDLKKLCMTNGGSCNVFLDGYYVVTSLSILVGFVWFGIFRNVIKKYQSLNVSHWVVNVDQTKIEDVNQPCFVPST